MTSSVPSVRCRRRRRIPSISVCVLLGTVLAAPVAATTVSGPTGPDGVRSALSDWRNERMAEIRQQLLQRREALFERAADLRQQGRDRRDERRREAEALRQAMQDKREELLAQMAALDARMGDLRRNRQGATAAVVPLPGAVVLLASGIAGLFGVASLRRRRGPHDPGEVTAATN